MRYLGGKSKVARELCGVINRIRKPGQPYWEPFVGGGAILERIRCSDAPSYASDFNHYLIAMWQALQDGWEPPSVVTEDDYRRAKAGEFDDALTAFIGFGCSFGGKWFGSYQMKHHTRPNRTLVSMTLNSFKRMEKSLSETKLFHANFITTYPPGSGMLIYCDPPYNGTSGYDATDKFDTPLFWDKCRALEAQGHTVLVSEYEAPADYSAIWSQAVISKKGMHRTTQKPRECLFRLGDHPILQPSLFEVMA